MKTQPRRLLFIFFVLLLSLFLVVPNNFDIKFNIGSFQVYQKISLPSFNFSLGSLRFDRDMPFRQGLDLSGGTHLVLQADMKDIPAGQRDTALDSAREIIDRRVNLYGVSEPIVQSSKTANEYRIIVELPGVQDANQAISLIGQTARLEFREFKEASASSLLIPTLETTNSTGVTGKDLESAQADFDPQTGAPVVSFVMTNEGAKKFETVTKRLVGKPLAIFLDQFPVSWPTVNAVISKNGIIQGNFTTEETKNLALQLNAGALPVPIKVIEQRNIGATLGRESLDKSLVAGVIGLSIVILFMVLNYGFLGLIADIALVIYTLVTLALFKVIPVTLTLAGIAGFILSIGMAVDANILIFERMKEEIRLGKSKRTALELGFSRAWSSIWDSNASSLITCAILYWFGSGIIRGFAVTLAIGIIVSLFSAIFVTKTLLKIFYKSKQV